MWVEHSSSSASAAPGDPAQPAPLFVVLNPGSGAQDAEQTREVLSNLFKSAGRRTAFFDVDSHTPLAQACDSAGAQAHRQGGILVAAGGDGTVNTAAQAALRHGCPLGLIPQGTFNYVARDHGIPLEVEAAAQALLRARPCPVQTGRVNDQVFLVNASLGLYPRLLEDREAFNARFGRTPWTAVISGLGTVFRWRRQMTLDIDLDGRHTVLRAPTLFVANNRLQLERLGVDAAIAEDLRQGRLAGLVPKPVGSWSMLMLALRGALGRLDEADEVRSFSFQQLELRVRGRRRIKVATDGEVRVMNPPLRFSVAQPLQMMIPAEPDRALRE